VFSAPFPHELGGGQEQAPSRSTSPKFFCPLNNVNYCQMVLHLKLNLLDVSMYLDKSGERTVMGKWGRKTRQTKANCRAKRQGWGKERKARHQAHFPESIATLGFCAVVEVSRLKFAELSSKSSGGEEKKARQQSHLPESTATRRFCSKTQTLVM
jgi:hypothetical protein